MGTGDLDLAAGATPTLSMRIVSKRIHQQWHGAPRVAQVATLADTVYPEYSYQRSGTCCLPYLLHAAHQRKAEVPGRDDAGGGSGAAAQGFRRS